MVNTSRLFHFYNKLFYLQIPQNKNSHIKHNVTNIPISL